MGLFSDVGSIIGGISGADDEAPDIFDEFKPRSVFRGGFRGGGRTVRIVQTNQGGSRFVLGRNRAARRSFAGLERLQGSFGKTLNRSRRDFDRVDQRFGRVDRSLRRLSRRFGRGLIRARVKPIKRAGRQAVGNLREQFAARNLAGSSFALREQAGVEAEFGALAGEAKAEARAEVTQTRAELAQARAQIAQQRAQVFQAELQERARINQQRLGVIQTRIQTELNELGLTAEVQNSVNQLAARIALAQTGLEAQAATDRGSSFQNIFSGIDGIFGSFG